MSNRFYEFDKGSSRSTRDDSRTHKGRSRELEKRNEHKSRDDHKSRSRSPRKHHSPHSSSKSRHSKRRSESQDEDDKRSKSPVWQINNDSDEDVPAPPPPPRISKISIGFSKPKEPIKMNFSGPAKPTPVIKPTVASVFNADDDDDDEEPEEMPAEAKMRMRNIGRETPTSAGPNSFGKTKQGFCDAKKVFEKNLKEALETADKKAPMTKFPQTIYHIKGP